MSLAAKIQMYIQLIKKGRSSNSGSQFPSGGRVDSQGDDEESQNFTGKLSRCEKMSTLVLVPGKV